MSDTKPSDVDGLAEDLRYLVALADLAAGEGFCPDGIEGPDEWCSRKWDALGKPGEDYSADALADAFAATTLAAQQARIEALERALQLWVAMDRRPERELATKGPMLAYAEALKASRAVLSAALKEPS